MKNFLTSTCRAKIFGICVLSFSTLIFSDLYSQNSPLPFNQAAVKQSTDPALLGPDASKPYFTVRFAHPIQPDNDEHANGPLVGIDKGVHDYHQSPAFEIMPNGDVLAIPYSGLAHREGGHFVHLVQSRLRYGAEEFDMPEEVTVEGVRMSELLQPDGKPMRGHGPPLMWREGNTVWLFTGAFQYPTADGSGFWGMEPMTVLFRVYKSIDNGATWTTVAAEPKFFDQNGIEYGQPGSRIEGFNQPITNAFRDNNGHMLVAVDGAYNDAYDNPAYPSGRSKNRSLLFRSPDNGLTWYDQGGANALGGTGTSGRHSTIVPLNSTGKLLALSGKDTSWDPVNNKVLGDGRVRSGGFMPMNISTDWGKTWQAPTESDFPWLGGNQRPSMIRLANGNLVVVGDSRHSHWSFTIITGVPSRWAHGDAPYVALSTNNGQSWTIKALPVALKHVISAHKTIGYSTVRQAPNGVIHLLTTRTHPMLHYEFNEAWITDPSVGDITPETTGGKVKSYKEKYPDGKIKATWSARITSGGRYLLNGVEIDYYENGKKMREVTWVSGRRSGMETLWGQDGTKIWSWDHDLANNVSTWTHWWTNGQKRLESQWNTNPVARDLPTRHFRGLVSNGTARHWNMSGQLVGTYTFLNGDRISHRGNYTENFSTDPSGRGWAGSNTTTGGNDIKWSSSTRSIWCSPETPGAISAVFARSSAYHYYADTSIGAKNRTQTLHISGNWIIKDANYLGTFRIGYFNKANPSSNFIGIEFREPAGVKIDPLNDYSGKVFRAYLSVKGTGGTTSTVPIEPHMVQGASFDLIWKGNPDGSGTLSGTLTGRPMSITVDAGSGSFDSFGILTGGDSSSDSTKKTDICYFDNLVYDKGTVTTYTVTYNANRASSGSVPSNQTKPHGVELPLSTKGNLIRKGYTFDGWNTAADGTGKSYAPGALYSMNTDVTLYARWKKK